MQSKVSCTIVVVLLLGSVPCAIAGSNERAPASLVTSVTGLFLEGRPPASSTSNEGASAKVVASISQSEAASIAAHGGGTTLQDCMTLWDAATHMSKQEWKVACKRSIVVEFPESAR